MKISKRKSVSGQETLDMRPGPRDQWAVDPGDMKILYINVRTNKEVSVVEEGTGLLTTCGLTATDLSES